MLAKSVDRHWFLPVSRNAMFCPFCRFICLIPIRRKLRIGVARRGAFCFSDNRVSSAGDFDQPAAPSYQVLEEFDVRQFVAGDLQYRVVLLFVDDHFESARVVERFPEQGGAFQSLFDIVLFDLLTVHALKA